MNMKPFSTLSTQGERKRGAPEPRYAHLVGYIDCRNGKSLTLRIAAAHKNWHHYVNDLLDAGHIITGVRRELP